MKKLQEAQYALPETVSPELKDFLAQMIQPDVSKRLTAEDALKHPWVLADDQTEEEVDVCEACGAECRCLACPNLDVLVARVYYAKCPVGRLPLFQMVNRLNCGWGSSKPVDGLPTQQETRA